MILNIKSSGIYNPKAFLIFLAKGKGFATHFQFTYNYIFYKVSTLCTILYRFPEYLLQANRIVFSVPLSLCHSLF